MAARWTEGQLAVLRARRKLKCQGCGRETEASSPSQRYCADCSQIRDVERKSRWAKGNKRPKPPGVEAARRSDMRQRGHEISRQTRGDITSFRHPALAWMVRFSVPFSYAASKNHIYAMSRSGHVTLRKESSAFRSEIARAVAAAVAGRRIAHNKVWIDVFAQKPDHKGDAVNVVDLVCDAIKDAIPVDDRWFSIRGVDWEVVKGEPGAIFIGIGQESEEDVKICSCCGRILPFVMFGANRSTKTGRGRDCFECRRARKVA